VIGLLFRLLLMPFRMVLLSMKTFRAITTFITCVVPLMIVIAIGAGVAWLLFAR
jgi:hypothetical protein